MTFLGTGTSTGVPVVGCGCPVCLSQAPRDKRFRTSVMLESGQTRIIIDCGPDFRQQMLRVPYRKIDGVLLTHIHYDHVGGLDDLRPFCSFGSINVYADASTVEALHHTMPYVFAEHLYPGVPRLELRAIQPRCQFYIGDIPVMPFVVMHHDLPIMAYRFGRFAYITDMKTIDDAEREYLHGIDTLVVNALRFAPGHHSHMLVDEAVSFARSVRARRVYFVHATHDIGLHDHANSRLPEGFEFAYDGQQIEVEI
ncbi:MAG: MBL fold metallo-hydrolase [Prevotella sp.]